MKRVKLSWVAAANAYSSVMSVPVVNQLKIPVELVPKCRRKVTSGRDGWLSIEQSGADAKVKISQSSYLSANKGSYVKTVDV
jgi:hypothetical protein